jgi:hypothetical protein
MINLNKKLRKNIIKQNKRKKNQVILKHPIHIEFSTSTCSTSKNAYIMLYNIKLN